MNYRLKCIVLLFLFLIPLLIHGQDDEFILKGQLGRLSQPAKVYLYRDRNGVAHWDSTLLTNGMFCFRGQISRPELCTLTLLADNIKKPESRMIYLENGTIEIVGDSSLKTARIMNSKLNDDFIRFRAQLEPYSKLLDSINNNVNDASTVSAAGIQQAYSKADSLKLDLLKDYIVRSPGSYFSIGALILLGQLTDLDLALLEPLYNSLTQQVKNTEAGKEFMVSLEKKRHTGIGSMAPDFVQDDISGHPIKLSDFRGKYVLLDFWASWCGPCRKDNPHLLRAYNKFKRNNFTILSVSLDSKEKGHWLKAIEQDGIGEWTNVSDLKYWSNAVALLYSIKSIPANFLIDPSGRIIAKDLHGNELDTKLSALFYQR